MYCPEGNVQVAEARSLHRVGGETVPLADVTVELADVVDPCLTNLAHFHPDAAFEKLCETNFTRVRKLSNGINGDIFLYRWRRSQEDEKVAVKKVRNGTFAPAAGQETNERAIHLAKCRRCRNPEDSLTDLGVLLYLSKLEDLPKYFLKLHGVFSDSASNLTWLVTEFAEGGELFNVARSSNVAQEQLRIYMWQLLHAVEYLHRHRIGHRDISLENVLLKDGVCKVMDFGMAVSSRSASGIPLRYFRTVGKAFYRAPECFVPDLATVTVTPPIDAAPGDVVMVQTKGYLCEVRLPEDVQPNTPCTADVWGYATEPADVFALGVCMFILAFQCPPWEDAHLSNQCFSFVNGDHEKGLESLLKLWKKPCLNPDTMLLLTSMMQIQPTKRPSAANCLQTPWLDESK